MRLRVILLFEIHICIYTVLRSLHCALCDTSEPCFICMNFEAVIINTLRTGDADLRFYITTVQDG